MRIHLVAVAILASLTPSVTGFTVPQNTNGIRKHGVAPQVAKMVNTQVSNRRAFVPQVALSTATSDDSDTSTGAFDFDAVFKYSVALGTQLTLFYGIFTGLDKLVAAKALKVPVAANFILFYFIALKSRVLNPLLNRRPQPKNLELEESAPKRVMPSWTPPGVTFPIMWLLIIGPIRAASSVMMYQNLGAYANPAIMSLMLHLSIGDVWNTINNTERRYGVAVTGVVAVLASKVFAAFQYYNVNALAGKLLGGTCIWLTVATALIAATWRLNPDPATGKPEPLYPVKGAVKTQFLWFAGKKDE